MGIRASIIVGIAAGVIWGWVSMLLNSFTAAFAFESGFMHNLASFSIAGGLFGALTGGFLFLGRDFLPFKGMVLKSICASSLIWLVLRAGGALLSSMEPERYHILTPEAVQGFVLSIALGAIIGLLWKKKAKEEAFQG